MHSQYRAIQTPTAIVPVVQINHILYDINRWVSHEIKSDFRWSDGEFAMFRRMIDKTRKMIDKTRKCILPLPDSLQQMLDSFMADIY